MVLLKNVKAGTKFGFKIKIDILLLDILLLESCLTFFTPSDANALAYELVSKGVKGNWQT